LPSKKPSRKPKESSTEVQRPLDFGEGTVLSVAEAEADALSLLALFYYRRVLDRQAISLLVRYFHPLNSFFQTTERELKLFFAEHRHLRGLVDAAQLVSQTSREAAFRYADRQRELMSGGMRGSFLIEAHPSFPQQLRRSRLPIDWIFSYSRSQVATPSPVVAVVGSRSSTSAQLRAAEEIAHAVGALGGTVVTGLATGADAAAHAAARDTEASIIGVLGSGVGKVYPPSHTNWVRELMAGRGVVLSEVPSDYGANADAFVLRNRIVASMSDLVVAVSGKYASGTSHTVRFAADARVPVVSVDAAPNSGISKLVEELGGTTIPVARLAADLRRGDDA
jgi:predicted Rossmann fold nucleotide-binding protein DprA/Smf involved in DNA uptake